MLAQAMLGRALCILGFPEQGYHEAAASSELILRTSDRVSICRVLSNGMCRVAFLIGDLAAADQAITQMIDAANTSNTLFWQIEGRFLEGKLFVERGEFEKGLAALRNAFEEFRRAGWRASYLEFNGALAEALAGTGQLTEALRVVHEAVESASRGDRDGQMWCLPELLRIEGELLVQQDSMVEAEVCFTEAIQLAREQGSLLWELRIALSVARSRLNQDLPSEAKNILGPVYSRFKESLATADMQVARALLDSLSELN
jgi:predicted ATPase